MAFINDGLRRSIEDSIKTFREEVGCKNAGLVVDDGTEILRHNSDYRGSSASLIKLVYAAASYQKLLETGQSPENVLIGVDPKLLSGSPGSMLQLEAGRATLIELLENMVSHSCNDSANHIVDYLTHEYVNRFAAGTGLPNTASKALFERHPDFGEGNVADGVYAGNSTSADDVHRILKRIFHDGLYNTEHPNYIKLDPHRNIRVLLEECSRSRGFPHPLGVELTENGFVPVLPHEGLWVGQKFGIQFHDLGACGYFYPIRGGGMQQAYFISVLINGFGDPLKDYRRRGTDTLRKAVAFVSGLSKMVYERFSEAQIGAQGVLVGSR
ncbi:MAG: serine hydrolase [Nanoarchaeota archaeon]